MMVWLGYCNNDIVYIMHPSKSDGTKIPSMAIFIKIRMNKNIYSQHERQAVVYQVPEIYAKQQNCWQEANLAACRRAAAEGYEVLKRGARIAAGSCF